MKKKKHSNTQATFQNGFKLDVKIMQGSYAHYEMTHNQYSNTFHLFISCHFQFRTKAALLVCIAAYKVKSLATCSSNISGYDISDFKDCLLLMRTVCAVNHS